jgi:phosphoadenosine phosphosulfate reductase
MHFPETLAYRDWLARRLGLTDLRSLHPDAMALRAGDPDGDLHRYLPDDCCALRKVAPLRAALAPFAAWVTGQRREQSPGRAALPLRETVDGRIKLNPLADWSAARVAAELDARDLPRHPLLARGYRSIGCFPCTRPTRPDEDPRAGRWPGLAKTECGIHRPGVFKSEPHPA